jgi:hypothetical protein
MEHTDEIPRPAIRRAVEEAKERLLLNRKLILLDGNAPLPLSAEELRHDFTRIGDTVRFCMDCLADAVQNMLLSVKEEP